MGKSKIIGQALATAAAIAFSTTSVVTKAENVKQVWCYGVNSCKGRSECATAVSACKGNNACKGKGALLMSKKQCMKYGGRLK